MINKYTILREVKSYVEKESKKTKMAIRKISNEVVSLRRQVSQLKKIAHAPREFVKCSNCKNKIKEA